MVVDAPNFVAMQVDFELRDICAVVRRREPPPPAVARSVRRVLSWSVLLSSPLQSILLSLLQLPSLKELLLRLCAGESTTRRLFTVLSVGVASADAEICRLLLGEKK